MNASAEVVLANAGPGIDDICRKFGVRRLWVFGSALSSRWTLETSDFDFLVEYGPPPPGVDLFAQQFVMQVELERLFEVVGEALIRVRATEPMLLEQITDSAAIIGMRNFIAHGYDAIDPLRAVETIGKQPPGLMHDDPPGTWGV